MAPVLSAELRKLSRLLAAHHEGEVALPPDACQRVGRLLAVAARRADELEARAVEADEIDDELHEVARDLVGGDPVAPLPAGYQAALREQQREIQRELDRGGPEHVSRPGLAALSVAIGDSNVVTFPKARP